MKRRLRRSSLVALALVTLAALAPIVSAVVATLFSAAFGCPISEAGGPPCVRFGHDWEPALYVMFTEGWMMIVTLPVLALALALWLLVGIAALVRRLRTRS